MGPGDGGLEPNRQVRDDGADRGGPTEGPGSPASRRHHPGPRPLASRRACLLVLRILGLDLDHPEPRVELHLDPVTPDPHVDVDLPARFALHAEHPSGA
jgi:hypothetical protein